MWSCPLRSSCKNVLYHHLCEGMSSLYWEVCMCVRVCVCWQRVVQSPLPQQECRASRGL